MTIPSVTDDLIAEIEAAAKAATPGPRRIESDEDSCAGAVFVCAGLEMYTGGEICRSYSYDDADLIAVMTPEVVLALIARIRELEEAQRWITIEERMPESGRTVMAYYQNSHGKGRRIRAEYVGPKTKSADDGWDWDYPSDYDEETDQSYWPAGWYECVDNWDELTHLAVTEAEITHWKPLPEPPA